MAGIEDPILLIKNNPVRVAKIKRLIREARHWVNNTIILDQEAEQLIHILNEEISKLE